MQLKGVLTMNERIKSIRKASGLNQSEFADRIGATRDKVASYETGRVIPTDTVLKLISKEFSVSYAWLKTGEGPMNDPLPNDSALGKLTETYLSLPERLRMMVDVLVSMDPEWYKTLDAAFEEIERRHKEKGAD